MSVSRAAFNWIRNLVEERSGNVLNDEKTYLVETRMAPIVESEGLTGVDALVQRLQSNRSAQLERRCLEALLIHESSFFRDPHYFEALATHILPDLIEQRRDTRRLTIWCAACATGQEPYSLAIILHERFPHLLSDWQLNFVASDLSQAAIEQARHGTYSKVEMDRGLSQTRTSRFFQCTGTRWATGDSLRRMIRFRECNLLTDQAPTTGIDIVLIRNVLIYMNDETRVRVLNKVRDAMAAHGHLMLGATESLFNVDVGFERTPGTVPTYRLT